MRKVFLNKWFILSVLLVISLSAFSFVAYKNTRDLCKVDKGCTKKPSRGTKNGSMILDALSRQFSSISIQ